MERGLLDWNDTNQLDRVRSANSQKYNNPSKNVLSKNDVVRKPYFCKAFQGNSCPIRMIMSRMEKLKDIFVHFFFLQAGNCLIL